MEHSKEGHEPIISPEKGAELERLAREIQKPAKDVTSEKPAQIISGLPEKSIPSGTEASPETKEEVSDIDTAPYLVRLPDWSNTLKELEAKFHSYTNTEGGGMSLETFAAQVPQYEELKAAADKLDALLTENPMRATKEELDQLVRTANAAQKTLHKKFINRAAAPPTDREKPAITSAESEAEDEADAEQGDAMRAYLERQGITLDQADQADADTKQTGASGHDPENAHDALQKLQHEVEPQAAPVKQSPPTENDPTGETWTTSFQEEMRQKMTPKPPPVPEAVKKEAERKRSQPWADEDLKVDGVAEDTPSLEGITWTPEFIEKIAARREAEQEQSIQEKGLEKWIGTIRRIGNRYKNVKLRYKIAIAAALLGAGAGGAALGGAIGTAVITATFAGSLGMRTLGAAAAFTTVEGLSRKIFSKKEIDINSDNFWDAHTTAGAVAAALVLSGAPGRALTESNVTDWMIEKWDAIFGSHTPSPTEVPPSPAPEAELVQPEEAVLATPEDGHTLAPEAPPADPYGAQLRDVHTAAQQGGNFYYDQHAEGGHIDPHGPGIESTSPAFPDEATPTTPETATLVPPEAVTVTDGSFTATIPEGSSMWGTVEGMLKANPEAFGYSGDMADTNALDRWTKTTTADILDAHKSEVYGLVHPGDTITLTPTPGGIELNFEAASGQTPGELPPAETPEPATEKPTMTPPVEEAPAATPETLTPIETMPSLETMTVSPEAVDERLNALIDQTLAKEKLFGGTTPGTETYAWSTFKEMPVGSLLIEGSQADSPLQTLMKEARVDRDMAEEMLRMVRHYFNLVQPDLETADQGMTIESLLREGMKQDIIKAAQSATSGASSTSGGIRPATN